MSPFIDCPVWLHTAVQSAFAGAAGLLPILPTGLPTETAGEPLDAPAPKMAPQGESPGWQWTVAPYLWAAGIDGEVTAGNVSAEFEMGFDDIWDNLESGALLWVEAQKDQLSLFGDVVFLALDMDGETPGGADVDADLDTAILDLGGLYRLSPTSPFELGLGLRYLSMETELDVGALTADSDSDSLDGFVAGRVNVPFAERWNASLYGDAGAGDADFTWQLAAMLGLNWDDWGLAAGYRMLDYEFEDGSDELDLTLEGVMLGVKFHF